MVGAVIRQMIKYKYITANCVVSAREQSKNARRAFNGRKAEETMGNSLSWSGISENPQNPGAL